MNIHKKKYEISAFLFVLLVLINIPVVSADTSFFYGQFVDRASSVDGSFTIKSMENNTIYLFEKGNHDPTWSYYILGNIFSVSISPDGKFVAIGSDGGLIWLFDQKGTVVWNKTFGNSAIRSVEFSSDSQFLDASNFINQAFFISVDGNLAIRPTTRTTTKIPSETPVGTQALMNLDFSWIVSLIMSNINILIGFIAFLCMAVIIWYGISHQRKRRGSPSASIPDIITLQNFTIFSLVLMLVSFLPDYYPLAEYVGFFRTVFGLGLFCFIIAYFLYAVKSWGAESRLGAVFMVAVPIFAYSFATSKIPDSTSNIFVYLGIQFCLFALFSAIVLFAGEVVKKGLDGTISGNRYSHYFQPETTYALFGVLIMSIVAVNAGSVVIFSDNYDVISSSIQKIFPQEHTNYQELVAPKTNVYSNLVTIKQTSYPTIQYVVTRTPAQTLSTEYTSLEDSKKYLDNINTIRAKNGVNTLQFDARVYRIALARVNDMDQYGYLDHTNPQTGTCPDSIKTAYGLGTHEFVAENAYGYFSSTGVNYFQGIENNAIESWMTSRGHRYNLLYPHTGGAIACSKGGHCVFLGLNRNRFGSGCHTAAEGIAYWNSANRQPNEI